VGCYYMSQLSLFCIFKSLTDLQMTQNVAKEASMCHTSIYSSFLKNSLIFRQTFVNVKLGNTAYDAVTKRMGKLVLRHGENELINETFVNIAPANQNYCYGNKITCYGENFNC